MRLTREDEQKYIAMLESIYGDFMDYAAATHVRLSQMERQLQGAGFVRIHRSRLVRRAAIKQVESKPSGDYVVRLVDGRELAGSRRYRRPLLEP